MNQEISDLQNELGITDMPEPKPPPSRKEKLLHLKEKEKLLSDLQASLANETADLNFFTQLFVPDVWEMYLKEREKTE